MAIGPSIWQIRILLISAIAFACACQAKPTPTSAQAEITGPMRFPHEVHVQQPCELCHQEPAVGQTQSPRPGQNSHASCSARACHASDFAGEPTPLCGLCHESLEDGKDQRTTLVPYPPAAGLRTEAVAFSHLAHLDADRMEQRLGFHISCIDCHALPSSAAASDADENKAANSELARPSHAACARCHASEATRAGSPAMDTCRGCHQTGREKRRDRVFISGDLQFRHSAHRSDRRGSRIPCATCHAAIVQQSELAEETPAQVMQVCVSCHNDEQRVAPQKSMSRCETCHMTRIASLSAIAPRSHMPATERPANHTQAFRRDHAADAARPTASCARCHTMVSGNRRDTCDECHQDMQPRDHVVTWREYDHGPQAATQPERCTTCHQVDFCVACHRTPPRSHFPSLDFRQGGHGTLAALNMRACVTCHQIQRDCNGSGCHQGGGI